MQGNDYRYECQHCGTLVRECEMPQGGEDGASCPLCPRCRRGPLKPVQQLTLPFKLRVQPALA